jgi:hypothetical protein
MPPHSLNELPRDPETRSNTGDLWALRSMTVICKLASREASLMVPLSVFNVNNYILDLEMVRPFAEKVEGTPLRTSGVELLLESVDHDKATAYIVSRPVTYSMSSVEEESNHDLAKRLLPPGGGRQSP